MCKGRFVMVEGKKVKLVARKEAGLVPCPGEAHSPEVAGGIDNCGLCAPRWGEMMKYEEPTPAACEEGFAVPVGWVDANFEAFEKATAEGKARMVEVVESHRSHKSYYNAWVKA